MNCNLLQEYIFVQLDIYQKTHQNKSIKTRLEGWLSFLSSDRPEDVIALIERYPDFRKMYEQTYEICQNIEQVMGMFSKELYELDRNTVRYMIDELQEENARQKEENARQKEENARQKEENARQKEELERKEEELQEALRRVRELEQNA